MTDVEKAKHSRRMQIFAAILVVLAIIDLAIAPLTLSVPGENVGLRLVDVAFCLIALTFFDRPLLKIFALLLGLSALMAVKHDHDLGMKFAAHEGRDNLILEKHPTTR